MPQKRFRLYKAQAGMLAGSTLDMVSGLSFIEEALIEDVVVFQVHLKGDNADSARAKIKRDLEGIHSYIWISRNKRGWGGTITQVEVWAARVEHVENLVSYYVTELFEGEATILDEWYADWSQDVLD